MNGLDRRVQALEQAAAEAAYTYAIAGMAVVVARETGVAPSTAAARLRRLWELDNQYQRDVLGLPPEQAEARTQEEIDADAPRFYDWLIVQLDYAKVDSIPERERRVLQACVNEFRRQFGREATS